MIIHKTRNGEWWCTLDIARRKKARINVESVIFITETNHSKPWEQNTRYVFF